MMGAKNKKELKEWQKQESAKMEAIDKAFLVSKGIEADPQKSQLEISSHADI